MKKSLNQIKSFGILGLFCLSLLLPSSVLAATSKPSCTLTVTTPHGEVEIDKKDTVLLNKGEVVEIAWESDNAKKAFVGSGTKNPVELEGSATSSPTKSRIEKYRFENGSKKTYCEVKIQVVEGSFDESTLATKSTKPTLQGEASGTRLVQVQVFKEDAKKAFYTSKQVRVKNGDWSAKINKTLPKGEYTVVLKGDKKALLNTIATSTLTIGSKTLAKKVNTASATTFVVEPVPLLVGGIMKPGKTVPISYVQVINIGKQTGKIEAFKVKQNGTAQTSGLTTMSVSNEQGLQGSVSASLFKDGVITIPVDITLGAGQMQLFTLKAALSSNIASTISKQYKLDVVGVTTNGTMQSKFPIRGTTWTVGY